MTVQVLYFQYTWLVAEKAERIEVKRVTASMILHQGPVYPALLLANQQVYIIHI